MTIQQNLTTVNATKKNDTGRIQYIVIHFTGNNGDTAYNNTQYFKSTDRSASAHYFVDEQAIWQCVQDGDIAWHCGTKGTYYHPLCRNANSIGIEMCSRIGADGKYYIKDETVENTVELTKQLMQKYGVPIQNILRHYDVTHKQCPEPFVRDLALWNEFKAKLESEEVDMKELEELKTKVGYIDDTVTNLHSKVSTIDESLTNLYDAVNQLIDRIDKRYQTIDEIPEYARTTVQKLINGSILKGNDTGLGLTEDMVRMLVILDRQGVFK